MSATATVAEAEAWIVRFMLPEPIRLGRWTIPHREYAVVQLRSDAGLTAASYVLSRDAPLTAPLEAQLRAALGRPFAELHSGAGGTGAPTTELPLLRVAALLDACAWDLTAQQRGLPLWRLLADPAARPEDPAPASPPAARGVAVCGYPQGEAARIDAPAEAAAALALGYRHVKLPALGTLEEVDARLEAIRALDDELEIILDLEASFTALEPVLERVERWRRHRLHWVEDAFMPARAGLAPRLVAAAPGVAIAIGDEWLEGELRGLLDAVPRPVLRLDHATLGGLSVARELALAAGGEVAQHIYPELQRHLVHAGLARPQLDVYMERPEIDFADRMLGDSALRGDLHPAPTTPGPCMTLDRELVDRHATWHVRATVA